jgi:hypothetical protein
MEPGDYDIWIENILQCARMKRDGRYEVICSPRISVANKGEKQFTNWYVSYQCGIKIEFLDGRVVEFKAADGARIGDDPVLSDLVNFITFGDYEPALETFGEDDLMDI